jgi:hypothetical protein
MTLSELLQSTPDLDTLRELALILTPELHAALESVQVDLPSRSCVVQALPLVDGRFMLGADLLSEIGPEGLYAEGFGAISPELLSDVEVITMEEALALRPVEEREDP